MRKPLQNLQNVDNFVDDITIFTLTWEQHLEVLIKLLRRLRKANLTVKPGKCFIGFSNIECLGYMVRDESFITRWGGGGYIRGGVGIFFGDVLGGENKNPFGQGGSYISSGIWWGGSDVFHWFLLSLKVKASGGTSPQDPPYPK